VADIDAINASSSNGLFVTGVDSFGACIGNPLLDTCGAHNVVPATNAGMVYNDARVRLIGPDGSVTFTTRDTLALGLGGSELEAEFTPVLSTGIVGDVIVEGMFFAVFGKPGEQLWPSAELPGSSGFFDPERTETTVVSIGFTGPNLTSPLVLEGTARVSGPTAVPEPCMAALTAMGLLLIFCRITAPARRGNHESGSMAQGRV
jgi:hypothetical protein